MSRVCTFTNCTSDPLLTSNPTSSPSNVNKFLQNRARRHKIDNNSGFTLISTNIDNLSDSVNSINESKTKNTKVVSDLTEIETLSTHLRFRRQSIQQMRISPLVNNLIFKYN